MIPMNGILDVAPRNDIRLDEREGPILHRDIGLIQPTEMDQITINRTKSKLSPFVPIIKTPVLSQNSGTQAGYSIEIEDPAEKTGYRNLGIVSENYLLLTNREVRELALEIASQSGVEHKESRIYWDGSRFAHIIDFIGTTEEVVEGDPVCLSLITRTSYDKSWRYEAALMGKRFVCDNGVLSGEFFARVSFKHTSGGDDENWKNIVREGLSVIRQAPDNLQRFVKGLRTLKSREMSDAELRRVWKQLPNLGPVLMGKIMDRYLRHEEPTLYGLLNAGTRVFWHNQTMTASDFTNNDAFTTGLFTYALENQN